MYKNPSPLSFRAVIQRNGEVDNAGAYVGFPYDLKETFGVGNLVPFKATFDGRVTYRGSLAKRGGSEAILPLRKDVGAELGKEPGEKWKLSLSLMTNQES